MIRRAAAKGDLPGLLRLWLDCFCEKEEAAKLFFEKNISNVHAYLTEDNGEIISALYLISCRLNGEPAHYLCGASTRHDRRGEGLMSALIEFALDDAARRGDCCSVLLPADDGLYRFYERFGYREGGAVCRRSYLTDGGDEPYIFGGEPDYERLQTRCGNKDFLLWNEDYIRFIEAYYACYGVNVLRTAHTFALVEQDGGYAEVFYAIYDNLEELKSLLRRLGVRRFVLTGSVNNPELRGCAPLRRGMIKPLKPEFAPPGSVWIGLTLK